VSRVLGVDCGTKRVGVAISDGLRMLASPHSVFDRDDSVEGIAGLVEANDIGLIVVGLPAGLSGVETWSTEDARNLGEELRRRTGVDVEFFDERFTTRMAESSLIESGMKRRDRRATVDKVAAAIILQDYLDTH
jgi:putative Holliday junction resolvase